MAVESEPGPPGRADGLRKALLGDVHARWPRGLLLLAAAAGCAVAASLMLAAHSRAARPTPAASGPPRVVVTSRAVGRSVDYTGLMVAGGKLLLVDHGNGASGTSLSGGRCKVATVDPRSLHVRSVARGACDDPALFHQHVLAVDQWTNQPTSGGGLVTVIRVRIATASRRARSGYRLGPVVVSYWQCSSCWSESIDGSRSLWIYAPFSTPGDRDTGEALRVSARTGRVLERWPMPSLSRALLAVDRDGLWLAPSIESGEPGHLDRTQQRRYASLYHLTPAMRTPTRVLAIGTRANPDPGARFLVAADHRVWFETSLTGVRARLWQLDTARPTIDGKRIDGPADCTDLGEGPAAVLGNETMGIYCVAASRYNTSGAVSQNVFHISPGELEQQRVATVTPPPETSALAAAVTFHGSYYFLDARTPGHAGVLFRVTPTRR